MTIIFSSLEQRGEEGGRERESKRNREWKREDREKKNLQGNSIRNVISVTRQWEDEHINGKEADSGK
jgi:hypothetical protein